METGQPQGLPLQRWPAMRVVSILDLLLLNAASSRFLVYDLRCPDIKSVLLDGAGIDLLIQIQTETGRVGNTDEAIRN